jgi:hypothetical protein
MADSTLKRVSLTSIVAFDCAVAARLNNANISASKALRKEQLRRAS